MKERLDDLAHILDDVDHGASSILQDAHCGHEGVFDRVLKWAIETTQKFTILYNGRRRLPLDYNGKTKHRRCLSIAVLHLPIVWHNAVLLRLKSRQR